MADKISVGVIFGGRSSEHMASLESATSVLEYLNPEKFEVVPIGITQTGKWLMPISPAELQRQYIPLTQPHHTNDSTSVSTAITHSRQSNQALITQYPLATVEHKIDIIFPLIHGTYGEDGTLQGLLEMSNIPYVGCGVLGSALCMDKEKTKQVLQAAGLPVVEYRAYRRSAWDRNPEGIMDNIEDSFAYPCFVKPANGGSSIGVSKVRSREQLRQAVELAVSYDRKFLVEKAISCREIECAVLGNDDPQPSVVGEVLIREEYDFYDYHAKYIVPSEKVIPANIPTDIAQEVQRQSILAFEALDLSGLARFDFFLDKETGNIYINEVNTLPSFTEECMYPKLCEASGLSYTDLLERLIEMAVEAHADRQRSSPLNAQ
jgi:D-alanine-D-alanine ligase